MKRQKSLDQVLAGLLCFYNRAEDKNLLSTVKIEENDLFVIYYLVKLLEEYKTNEDMVQLILQVLLIPVVFTLHPENHALHPEQFLKVLRNLNVSVYEFKIASVAREFKDNQ